MVELELEDPRWLSFVSSCGEASPFHHPAWAAMLARCYDLRPSVVAVSDGEGEIEAGLPMLELRGGRLLSLPYTDYCPPLARSDAARERLAAELAATRGLELHAPLAGAGLVPLVRGVRHVLDLEADADAVRRRFHPHMRRNVTRAERDGAVVRVAETRADLVDTFYGLHLRTRRRQGVPVQPRRFFRLLWDDLLEPGLGTLLLAYRGPTPVAGAVFLGWNGTVIYKFGASDPAHWRLRPNNLLFWEAIRAACVRGDRELDFGRTDLEQQGLREFKSGWGAREEPLLYTFTGTASGADARRRVAGALGATIRRSPLWVCRAVGEVAYRYAA